jgi:RND family efflux transporter MFP subunit
MLAIAGRAMLSVMTGLLLTQTAGAQSLDEFASRASCLIAPFHVYKLAMPTPGPLASVAINRADVVKKGQVIAQLESVVEQAQVDAARVRSTTDVAIRLKTAVYTAAAAKLERQRKLRLAAVTSEQSLEEAEAAASVAKEEIEQARLDKELAALELVRLEATLERRILRAPAEGVVTSVELHAGEYADPTNPVATVTEIDPLTVDVYLPTRAYPLVSMGMSAAITPQEPLGGPRDGLVITKDPQIDAASGLFLVQLRLPNPGGTIPAGVHCSVKFTQMTASSSETLK